VHEFLALNISIIAVQHILKGEQWLMSYGSRGKLAMLRSRIWMVFWVQSFVLRALLPSSSQPVKQISQLPVPGDRITEL
jgi:hypothetical protein